MAIIANTDTAALDQIQDLVSIVDVMESLTHDVITQDVFLGSANIRMEELVSTHASLTGDDRTKLRIATMKQCAINILIPSLRTKSESADDLSRTNEQLTITEIIAEYKNDIKAAVDSLTASEGVASTSRYISAAVVV